MAGEGVQLEMRSNVPLCGAVDDGLALPEAYWVMLEGVGQARDPMGPGG